MGMWHFYACNFSGFNFEVRKLLQLLVLVIGCSFVLYVSCSERFTIVFQKVSEQWGKNKIPITENNHCIYWKHIGVFKQLAKINRESLEASKLLCYDEEKASFKHKTWLFFLKQNNTTLSQLMIVRMHKHLFYNCIDLKSRKHVENIKNQI